MLGWLRGKLRSERTVIQINLSFALMFFHISALVHDAAYANAKSCEFIAISIHYFMLASGKYNSFVIALQAKKFYRVSKLPTDLRF